MHGEEEVWPHPRQGRNHRTVRSWTRACWATSGADRVTIDAALCDLLAPAPLDGLIEAQDDRTAGGEGRDQQEEQNPASLQRVPAGAREYAVIVLERPLRLQARDAQRRGDGAPAG